MALRTSTKTLLPALAVMLAVVSGCSKSPVSSVPTPAPAAVLSESSEPVAGVLSEVTVPAEAIQAGQVLAPILPTAAASDEPSRSEEVAEPSAGATPVAPPVAARPDRAKGLGQFGGGGGMDMGGMMGGGGGGMGGMMGGMGGGGGGGGGGVSIDPKISLKADSTGKLDLRRKQATSGRPKAGFSSK